MSKGSWATAQRESKGRRAATLAKELSGGESAALYMTGRMMDGPLPRHSVVLNPDTVSGLPLTSGGLTMSIDATVKESGNSSLKLAASGAISSVNLRCPLSAGAEYGRLPRVGGRAHLRVRCSDWSKITRFYLYFGQGGGISNAYLISMVEGGKSFYPMMAPTHQSAWNDNWRTIPVDMGKMRVKVGAPADWGNNEASRYLSTDGVAFTLTTTGSVDIWVDRIYSPEWPLGFVTTILDGSYNSAINTVFSDYAMRGWRGGGSLFHSSPLTAGDQFPTAESLRRMSDAGWDVFPHGLNTALGSAFSSSSTAAEIAAARIDQIRWLIEEAGVSSRGMIFSQFLQNSGFSNTKTMAQIQEALGAHFGRADCDDAEFGIDPLHTNTWSSSSGTVVAGYQAGWCSSKGRFNLVYQAAYSGQATPEARNTYAQSLLQKAIKWSADMADGTVMYIHNVVPLDGTNPTLYDIGLDFYRSMLADLDGKVEDGKLLMLSPTDLYYLTYGRQGDVYMRWDGEWVRRSDGAIAF